MMMIRRCRFPTLHRCGAGHETGCRHTILCPALHSLDSYALLLQPIVALLTGCSQQQGPTIVMQTSVMGERRRCNLRERFIRFVLLLRLLRSFITTIITRRSRNIRDRTGH